MASRALSILLQFPSCVPGLTDPLAHRPVVVVRHGQHHGIDLQDIGLPVSEAVLIGVGRHNLADEEIVGGQLHHLVEAALEA